MSRFRLVFPLIFLTILVGSGHPPDSDITESKPEHSILQPSDVARVPVILEGLVIADEVSAGPAHNSPLDGRPAQLWRARVHVENVLQGEVNESDVDVYYFHGSLPGSARSIHLRSGERNIFFLRRDRTKLRTNDDRSANACLLKVRTGPHPKFRRTPGASVNKAIIRLLLTRGTAGR